MAPRRITTAQAAMLQTTICYSGISGSHFKLGAAMKRVWLIAAALGVMASTASAEDGNVSKATLNHVTSVCQTCHGPKGDSGSATFPRLNGQRADYVAGQLKNFRGHNRSDPHAMAYMWGMASQLDDTLIANIANYYAGQNPTQPQTGGALAAEGKKIFTDGVAEHGITPSA